MLHAEALALPRIAEDVGTPFYCYSSATLERHFKVLDAAFAKIDHLICYSLKANSNIAVIKTLANLGAGVDIVSGGELHRARAAGLPGEKIVFSGVGKTADELAMALDAGIYCFNVESEPELAALSEIARRKGVDAAISLRINPDVDARTHEKITTGRAEDKFGIGWAQAGAVYGRAAALPGIRVSGVDMHIGSQITDLAPFERAFSRLGELVRALRGQGHEISHVNIGGGLGVPYKADDPEPPHPDDYAALAIDLLGGLDCRILLEPGRMIAANAGILVCRVIYVKKTPDRTFAIVDAAMNDLVRPTLYDAYHDVRPVREPAKDAPMERIDVVGPVCESGDYLALGRNLPVLAAGDLIAFMTAGAYGAVQSGTYNSRPLIPEVMVRGEVFAVIRERPELDALIASERLPVWLAP